MRSRYSVTQQDTDFTIFRHHRIRITCPTGKHSLYSMVKFVNAGSSEICAHHPRHIKTYTAIGKTNMYVQKFSQ